MYVLRAMNYEFPAESKWTLNSKFKAWRQTRIPGFPASAGPPGRLQGQLRGHAGGGHGVLFGRGKGGGVPPAGPTGAVDKTTELTLSDVRVSNG
jgi:hypothetical protein